MDDEVKVKTGFVCPECGAVMSRLDPEGHALSHFPEYLDPAKSSPEARKRRTAILAGGVSPEVYAKIHESEA